MASLELRHISKSFGQIHVLHDASLKVADGEFVVLLGPSGCGKSTLLRIIAGLESQSAGTVLIDDACVDHLAPRDRDIAMVFQQYALYPHLTVRENLAFGLKMRHEPAELVSSRIQEAAELLDIHMLLDRRPRELSGGQRQRVAMGRALVRKPKLFLFDEPLSNLDARLRTSTRVELKNLHQKLGATMIYVTHDQVEAMTLGEKIVVMEQGHIRQVGSPNEIYQTPASPFVAGFIGSPPMNLLEGRMALTANGIAFQCGNTTIRLPVDHFHVEGYEDTQAILGIRPEDILAQKPQEPHVSLTTIIEVIEHLGADQLVYLILADHRLIMRTSPADAFTAHQELLVHFPLAKLHLFVNGRKISTVR